MSQVAKYTQFKALHQGPCFILPNPWNAGTARILADMGFAALATTSAGHAFSLGKRDSQAALTRADILQNAAEIAAATALPTSGDLENGFGDTQEDCAETIRQAIAVGLAGGSIEDYRPGHGLYPIAEATDRIRASAEAAQGRFMLTARAENFLYGVPCLRDTITRLQAYAEAGADVLYAPGLSDLATIRTLCAELPKPVNVLMGLQGQTYTLEQLAEAGAARVSVGGSLARAALGAFLRAASELRDHGSFTYAASAAPDADIAAMMEAPSK